MWKTSFIILILATSCAAEVEDYKVNFSYDKYPEERAKIYKIFRKEFEKEHMVRQEMKLPKQDPSIGIDKHDLNEDGKKEIFVLFQSPYFCGASRCKMKIYQNTGQGLNPVFDAYINDIVIVTTATSNGFKDILIGSGVTDEQMNRWQWSKGKYTHSRKTSYKGR